MRALFLCIALFILSALPALATDVLILQSSQSPAYMEALRGFRSAFTGSSNTIVIADYAEVDAVRLVKEERPRLVLAVGDTALAACRKVRQVPVVSLMSLSLTLAKVTNPNIGGVGVVAAPERYLSLFKAIGAGRVGVLYDPRRSGAYLKRAQQAARRLGIDLVTREVRNPKETVGRLEQLKGSVDALWMLPDTTAVTLENLDAYFRFSLEQQVPLITFASQYLGKGAFAALEADRLDQGSVVVEQIRRVLGRDGEPWVADPRKLRLSTNASVASKLGIPISGLERIVRDTEE
ncbi:ABC transporter substrate-binding protein [Geobacter argillaceus]|uniref:ABC-type uncharacterized transport system substrate-binding protein n=1 Tax=Geobacter argillaceus TaxID=345631 RepID=A0A562VPU8_9BACT|nr:ABC transporter substrate binding protein [Geobacter argillaceus]TWJ19872.1 ABC-type uncharacterized transport system substrate-binding protein [Geobacter argillaceus]